MFLPLIATGLLLTVPPSDVTNKNLSVDQAVETSLSSSEASLLQRETLAARLYIYEPQQKKTNKEKKQKRIDPITTVTNLLTGETKEVNTAEEKDMLSIFKESDTDTKTIDLSYIQDSSNKTYMGYQKVTAKTSRAYKILNDSESFTDEHGFRCHYIDGEKRYFVAVGQGVSDKVGTVIDVVLSNGNIIPGIVGDRKANKHTDKNNIQQIYDGSVVEFIVDENSYKKGFHPEWDGNIDYITIKKNVFEDSKE